MARARFTAFAAFSALVALSACATMSDAIRNKNEGTARVYAKPCDTLWPLAIQVLHDNEGGAVEEHRSENYMAAASSMGLFTAGTFMVVWLEPVAADKCNVTVVTKRKIATNVVTSLTETGFHERFSALVPPGN
jgi:hypothetical protein